MPVMNPYHPYSEYLGLMGSNQHAAMVNNLTLGPDNELGHYQQDPFRWIIVLLFDMVSLVNAILWISFASINSYAQMYYGVSSDRIDLLSTMFMILFLPGLILCAFLAHRYGIKLVCVSASALNLLAALLRYFSTLDDKRARPGGYVLALFGQILGGLAQPACLSLPGRIASVWFADGQRNIAIVLLSLSNLLGIAIGQVLPGVFVTADSGLPDLQLTILLMAAVSCAACLIGFREAPSSLPASDHLAHGRASTIVAHLSSNFQILVRSSSFLSLSVGFGLGLGVFNVLLTKIEEIVTPDGFSPNDSGMFGAICIVCGFLGSGIFGATLDATKRHRFILRVCTSASLSILMILFICLKLTRSFALICIVFGALGFFLLPLMPICIECAALCTYPVPEEISTGVLMMLGNLLGFLGTLAISNYSADSFISAVSVGDLVLSLAFILAATAMFFFRGATSACLPIAPAGVAQVTAVTSLE